MVYPRQVFWEATFPIDTHRKIQDTQKYSEYAQYIQNVGTFKNTDTADRNKKACLFVFFTAR